MKSHRKGKKLKKKEVVIAPKVKTEDINDDIEEKVLGKDDFVSTKNIDQSNVSRELQKAEEEQRRA